jgi:hypothetical protein
MGINDHTMYLTQLYRILLLFVVSSCCITSAIAQLTDSIQQQLKPFPVIRVGVVSPLFLDSAFATNGTYKYKEIVPKFMMPGLDFAHGAELALDSLQLTGMRVHLTIIDAKAAGENSLDKKIRRGELDSLQLIIGAVRDPEFRQLAYFTRDKRIPFVSAVFPNDGGVKEHPVMMILNSTLRAHCEGIYHYLLQNHGTDKIIYCRRKGSQEDRIFTHFQELNTREGKPLLKWETIQIDSAFGTEMLQKKLDSNRLAVLIGASLDEGFAQSLANSASDLYKTYPIKLIGMPNWDGFKIWTKKDAFAGFPIYFTAPYFNTKTDIHSRMVTNGYTAKFKTRPSDMVFKGFECVYQFSSLLAKHGSALMAQINDPTQKLFSEYNIRPVYLDAKSTKPDYYENKHLFFVRMLNGVQSLAW